jgi:PleD family two-component response regulator
MTATASAPPLILIAAIPEHSLASVFQGRHYAVVQVHTATLASEWVRDVRPDMIIIDAELPDMSGIDACRLLHGDPRIGHTVPTLILAPNKPTPEQRVAALRAGVWDFLLYPPDPEELLLSLETYLQAKRNIDVALAGLMDPATGLHTRPALARRARELGALMSRARGGLACVVFALDAAPADPKAGSILVRSARVSDVVGALSPTEFAVLAPGTDQAGAVKLAQRIGGALRDVVGASGSPAAARAVQIGYDAVPNLKYSPIDPVALLLRATTAVRTGTPEPGCSWMRRFDESKASAREAGAAPRTTPSGLIRGNGGTGV